MILAAFLAIESAIIAAIVIWMRRQSKRLQQNYPESVTDMWEHQ